MSTPACSADPTDFAAARATCRRRDRVAFYLSHFLPPHKRQGVWAVVAGCRMIRDAVEAQGADCCSGGPNVAERIGGRLDAMYTSELELPLPQFRDETQHVLAALAQTLRRFEIPRDAMIAYLDACVADRQTMRYATWSALRRHCDGVSGSAAVIIACVLGLTHSDVRDHAVAIGRAARLIAILRQLQSDVARGRIYLPLEDLARCRYGERDLLAGVVDDRLRGVVAIQIRRAREAIKTGSAGLCWLAGDGARLAAATFVSLQLAMLDEIERADFDLFTATPTLTPARALRRLPGAWRLARRQPDQALPRM